MALVRDPSPDDAIQDSEANAPREPVRRVLLVVEAIRDGVFNQVDNLIAQAHAQRPGMRLDLCYSSHHTHSTFPALAERVRERGGALVDFKVSNAPGPRDALALGRILAAVRRLRPQVIHAHSSKAGGLVRLAGMMTPRFPPVLYTPHAYFGMGGQTLKHRCFNFAESALGRGGISTNCSVDERRFAREQLGIPARRLILLHHGIDLDRFRPASLEEKRALRRQLGLPEERPLVISIGRDSHQKNYGPLYAALGRLAAEEGLNFTYAHAGAGIGKLAAALPGAAAGKVFTYEHLSDPITLIRAADSFVLTSRFEGLSIAVLETLACGVRMLLTRVPGSACLAQMRFEEIDWIEPSEDPAELERRIHEKLRALNQVTDFPPSALHVRRMKELFDLPTQFGKLFRIYDYLADDGATRPA